MIKDESYRPIFLKAESGKVNQNRIGSIARDSDPLEKEKYIKLVEATNTYTDGFSAYLFAEKAMNGEFRENLDKRGISYLTAVNHLDTLLDGDVVELNKGSSLIKVLFRRNSLDNALVFTNQCNCNCIMCPDSVNLRRQVHNDYLDRIMELLKAIDPLTPSLCITGGEPTILKNGFLALVSECRLRLPHTSFTILSNGRMFFYRDFAEKFSRLKPPMTVISIPIHGHIPELHDRITSTQNSFIQTFEGVENLLALEEKVEIRIVINRLNYQHLINIAKMIINNLTNVNKVIFMTLEMLGNAVKNNEDVWIDFWEVEPYLNEAVVYLLSQRKMVSLYNFPLCYLKRDLWGLAAKSISEHKVRYEEECESCKYKNYCGGFFASTLGVRKIRVRPFNSEDACNEAI